VTEIDYAQLKNGSMFVLAGDINRHLRCHSQACGNSGRDAMSSPVDVSQQLSCSGTFRASSQPFDCIAAEKAAIKGYIKIFVNNTTSRSEYVSNTNFSRAD
jgi:hypothetical protein